MSLQKKGKGTMKIEDTSFCPECQISRVERTDPEMGSFCPPCGRRVRCVQMPKTLTSPVRGREHEFRITVALCPECGEELNPPGLLDQNSEELDRQYREAAELEYGSGNQADCQVPDNP